MKKNIFNSFVLFLIMFVICLIFSSCSSPSDIHLGARVRISLVSPVNDKVEARVFIEGYDGNSVNGAVVFVKDSFNSVSIFDYNFQQGCYYKLINKQVSEDYIFTVNSCLFDSPKIYTVPHIYLEDTIDIKKIEMVNEIGESYQNFDSLNTAYPIRITWSSTVEDCTYKVIIRTPTTILYEVSTNNKTIEIPANTIPVGTSYVYLEIQQQKSYGDIYFQDKNYYSVSVYSTGSISFNVM